MEEQDNSCTLPSGKVAVENKVKNTLLEAWQKFSDFETISCGAEMSVPEFVTEWEARRTRAQSAGCSYSDSTLAFKLLRGSNIPVENLHQILVSAPPTQSSSLLNHVKFHLENNCLPPLRLNQTQPDSVQNFVYSEQICKSEACEEESDFSDSDFSSNQNILSQVPIDQLRSRMERKKRKLLREESQMKRTVTSLVKDFNHNSVQLNDEIREDEENITCFAEQVTKDRDFGREHLCTYCPKLFHHPEHLKRHVRIHTGEKPYQCDVCVKAFTRNDSLTKHMRIHTGEKPYQCSVCQKSFTENTALTKHLRIHTSEKPFLCDVCCKAFSHKHNLIDHQRLHLGVKPFFCDICCKTFNHKAKMINHQRTHTGEKPFRCDVCPKTFSSKYGMTKHQRVHRMAVGQKTSSSLTPNYPNLEHPTSQAMYDRTTRLFRLSTNSLLLGIAGAPGEGKGNSPGNCPVPEKIIKSGTSSVVSSVYVDSGGDEDVVSGVQLCQGDERRKREGAELSP